MRIPASTATFASTGLDYDQYYLTNSDLDSDPWEVIPANVVEIRKNIPDSFVELSTITDSITEDIHSGRDEVFYISEATAHEKELETELLKPLLKGKDVKRYQPPTLIY